MLWVRGGLFYGEGGSQLWVQTYGVLATIGFTFTACAIVFLIIKHTVGLRVSESHELAGLDMSEHGMYGYPERFMDVPGATPEDYLPPEPIEASQPRSEATTSSTEGVPTS